MTILELLNAPWAIVPFHLEMIQQIYFDRKAQRISAAELKEIELAFGRPLTNAENRNYRVENGVAIVPVFGSMVKRGSMFTNVSGLASYDNIMRDIRQATNDGEVVAGIIDFDSPGGTANGVATAAELIRNVGLQKPWGAWTDGMMTSGAQWLAAATGDIRIANDTTSLGSIGVIGRHVDRSKAEEMDGYKTTVLTAGKYKGVGHPYAPLSVEDQAIWQAELDYMYTAFVNAMADYRGVSTEQVLNDMADGRIFTGRQAIDAGLADGMMSLEDMIGHMRDRAQTMKKKTISAPGGKASAEIPKEVKRMTRSELQEQHPALYAEIFGEGKLTGVTEATAAERGRIMGILNIPGPAAKAHHSLLLKGIEEGKSAGDVALAIQTKEAELLTNAGKDIETGAAKPAPAADPGVHTAPDAAQTEAVGDAMAKAAESWQKRN